MVIIFIGPPGSGKGTQAQILPADTIKIRQSLSFNKKLNHWFVRSQTIDFGYSLFGFKGDGSFVANYTNYDFNPKLLSNKNKNEILIFEKNANKKESSYWDKKRPIALTKEEFEDYVKKDSIETKRTSKEFLDSLDNVNNKFKQTADM